LAIDNEKEIAKTTAILDFYSNRAVAHASFFLASIFGLVAFSAIVHELGANNYILFWSSTAVFFGFSYMGYYTITRFGFYAGLASAITLSGLSHDTVFKKIPIDNHSLFEEYSVKYKQQVRFLLPIRFYEWVGKQYKKDKKYEKWINLATGCFYWIVIIIIGAIAFERFWLYQSIWFWILGMIILIDIFVVIPYLSPLRVESKNSQIEESPKDSTSK
jgi:hypothetical protein